MCARGNAIPQEGVAGVLRNKPMSELRLTPCPASRDLKQLLGHTARREELLDMLKILSDRIDASEVAIVTWFDLMEWRLDRSVRGIEERGDRTEKPLERLAR